MRLYRKGWLEREVGEAQQPQIAAFVFARNRDKRARWMPSYTSCLAFRWNFCDWLSGLGVALHEQTTTCDELVPMRATNSTYDQYACVLSSHCKVFATSAEG